MLERTTIVGQRIGRVFADTSLSDEAGNYADFVYQLSNGTLLRLPFHDDIGLHFNAVVLSDAHHPVSIPPPKWRHLRFGLWRARIADVLVVADPELRFPDSARIALTSGKFLIQMSYGPTGILPMFGVCDDIHCDESMVSIWSL